MCQRPLEQIPEIMRKKEVRAMGAGRGGVRRPLAAIALSRPKGGPRKNAGGLSPGKDDNDAMHPLGH